MGRNQVVGSFVLVALLGLVEVQAVEVPVVIPLGFSFDANSELSSGTFNTAAALVQDGNPERWSIDITVDELLADGSVESLAAGVVPLADMTVILVDGSDAFVDVSFAGGNSVSQNSDLEACARVLNPADRYIGPATCEVFPAGSF